MCFVKCYDDHQDKLVLPHSFPTRRSTDLLGARAIAGLAGNRGRHADLGVLAAIAVFERDFEIVAQVRAAIGVAAPAGAAAPAHELAEQVVEDVGKRREVATGAARPAGTRAPPERGRAVPTGHAAGRGRVWQSGETLCDPVTYKKTPHTSKPPTPH